MKKNIVIAALLFAASSAHADVAGALQIPFETVPANQLPLALWLESDRMGFLLDTLTQAKLDNQRQVVENERRQSVENVPYGPSEEVMVQTLFAPGHPYYGNVIGSMDDLNA